MKVISAGIKDIECLDALALIIGYTKRPLLLDQH